MKFRKLGIEIRGQQLYVKDRGEANTENLKKRVAELLRRDDGVEQLMKKMRMKK